MDRRTLFRTMAAVGLGAIVPAFLRPAPLGCEILGTYVTPRGPSYSNPLALGRKVGVKALIDGEKWGFVQVVGDDATDDQLRAATDALIGYAEAISRKPSAQRLS